MSSGRNFSYESHDDGAVSPDNETYEHQQIYHHSPYQDTPSRDIVSPPPQYTSPAPPEPITPTHARGYSSRGAHRRPVPASYDDDAPPPPPHRDSPTRPGRIETNQHQGYRPTSIVTPGMDNFSDRAQGGGLGHVAQGVADGNERESGLEALQHIQRNAPPQSYYPSDRDHSTPYNYRPSSRLPDRGSHSSVLPLAGGAATPGSITPGASLDPRSERYSARSIPLDDYPHSSPNMGHQHYMDSPYQNSNSYNAAVSEASINPNNILDDGDDGFMPHPNRKTMMTNARSRSNEQMGGGAGAGKAAASGGVLGGLFGRRKKNPTSSGSYGPVTASYDGSGTRGEKSEWLTRQSKGKNKMRWVVGAAIGAVIIIAIIAGIVGGVLGTHNSGDGSSGGGSTSNANTQTAAGDLQANGDLDKNSAEIKALMGNKNLHKVFPAIDYTPWGTQYPLCFTYPPSTNNVSRDMAVLSQLTNTVRLYGTDCNQTEMVLRSIDRLGLTSMKVWLGVWVDANETTTNRQIQQMYNILEKTSDLSIFKGVIIGNEALYRAGLDKTQSETQLIGYLTDARTKFKELGYNLPIATSDLGDNWNGQLVDAVDYVMSNIHPFFAGVTASVAAAWTLNFWNQHDVVLTQGDPSIKQVISETGWPSSGGTDCGGLSGECTSGQSGSVASVDNMNTYMNDWVCQALENGTDYFW